MTENKPLTGYPSIDKPWLKYYRTCLNENDIPDVSIYDYFLDQSAAFHKEPAMTYYGREISYDALRSNILSAAKCLASLGVAEGDRILYLMPNIPETAYFLYGGAMIGAVADYIDPRPDSLDFSVSAAKVLKMILDERISYIVSLDQCYLAMIAPIEEKVVEIGVKDCVLVSATDSMNVLSKAVYAKEYARFFGKEALKKNLDQQKKVESKLKEALQASKLTIHHYKELTKNSKNQNLVKASYKKDALAVIVHTSGTSSPQPKPIPLSHKNLNAYVYQCTAANMPLKKGDRALHILPYFAAYGISNVVHAGFCLGCNLIEIPEFSPNVLAKMIVAYKPQIINGVPSWYEMMTDDPCMADADLSHITLISMGGDTMKPEKEAEINRFLKQHGCRFPLTKGHGMSETCGTASYATGEYNKPGSVGIPFPLVIYTVIDPETQEEICFDGRDYIEGELAISAPTVTNGVLDGREIVPHVRYNGVEYIRTKDIARMDSDGIITFLDRSDRSFTRFDGYKIKPYEVEAIISEYPGVEACVVSPCYDEEQKGNMPLCDLVVKDKETHDSEWEVAFVRNLVKKCFVENPSVSSRQLPNKWRFRESLPITKNSKIDFRKIISEGDTGYSVGSHLNETNVSLGEIEIRHAFQ